MSHAVPSAALALALCCATPSAQSPVVVVDGVGPALQHAIDAASSGDVLIVRGGPYDALTVDGKGLSIAVEAGADVDVNAPLVVRNVPPTASVLIRGFDRIVDGHADGHRVEASQGRVWIEDCALVSMAEPFTGAAAETVLRIESAIGVVLVDCRIDAEAAVPAVHGVHAVGSVLALYGCSIEAGPGMIGSGPDGIGGDALRATEAFVHASGSTLRGGTGGSGASLFVPPATIVCHDGAPGGDALIVEGSGSLVELAAAVLIPGPGGSVQSGSACSFGPAGQASRVLGGVLQALPCAPRELAVAPAPAPGGTQVDLAVHGEPGELAAVGLGQAWFLPVPALCGVLVVPPKTVHVVGVVGAEGAATLSFLAPAFPAGFGQDVRLQAAVLTTAGQVIAGSPAALVLY